jgi:hypothetical protein
MTLRQLAQELRMPLAELEDKLNSMGESVPSSEDMCGSKPLHLDACIVAPCCLTFVTRCMHHGPVFFSGTVVNLMSSGSKGDSG